MGKRDYNSRESKKPKKDVKRSASPVTLSPPSPEPQVVERKRLPREEP
jgi:hypothetical protein